MPEEKFALQTYTNPVYRSSFPDPFVLKFRCEYFAYCTGLWRDGKVFGVLHSRDLVNWSEIGGAMTRLEADPPFYWAPEVTYSQGKFYLYYSAGNETLMEIRVAVSDRPDGGFDDSGKRLTVQDFAIDAHVFTDSDGSRYMFYATDFLEHTHIGTGTVVDKMIDWFTLEGKPRPVTRARYDWQVYDPARKEKGGVRWHTVEGPFILKRKGIYYEMFSGGNWQNVSYGVSYAMTDDIIRNEEWDQICDGEKILPILRTLPGKIIGPGHNSVTRGPNNRELFCIYHRWIGDERVLAIDRMDFAGRRIFINGATYTPQFIPFKPSFTGFSAYAPEVNGSWEVRESEAMSTATGENELIFREAEPHYLLEVYLQSPHGPAGSYGFHLADDGGKIFEFLISSERAIVRAVANDKQSFLLPHDFLPSAAQLLRVELDGCFVKLSFDDTDIRVETRLERAPDRFALTAGSSGATFSGLAVTRGFEDLFDRAGTAEGHGWASTDGRGRFHLTEGELVLSGENGPVSIIKGPHYIDYEFAVNIRLIETMNEKYCVGFMILSDGSEPIRIEIQDRHLSVGARRFDLPDSFKAENYHQFRILNIGQTIYLQMEEHDLGTIPAPAGKTCVAIFCENASVALDMVRLTKLY